MRKQRGRHLANSACKHRRTTKLPIAGMERVVCHAAGQVSVSYLHAVIEDDIVIADSDPIPKTG